MKKLVLVCLASFGLFGCSAEEQPPPPPAPTEVPLTTAEEALVSERITAIREAKTFEAAREASQMGDSYSPRMRERVTAVYIERYRQAVTDTDTEEELEPLRKLAPDMSARLHFNGRWIELRNNAQAAKN